MILEDLKLSFGFKIFTMYLVLQNIQLMILESRNNGIKKNDSETTTENEVKQEF